MQGFRRQVPNSYYPATVTSPPCPHNAELEIYSIRETMRAEHTANFGVDSTNGNSDKKSNTSPANRRGVSM